jgi:hypothetical protein
MTSSSMSYFNANLKTCHTLARYATPCKTNRIICTPSCALDEKFDAIARNKGVSADLARATSVLHRKPETSTAFWRGSNRLFAAMGSKFHAVYDAVSQAMQDTPRSSSLVENLNSRTRPCLSMHRHLSGGRTWLGLLQIHFQSPAFRS